MNAGSRKEKPQPESRRTFPKRKERGEESHTTTAKSQEYSEEEDSEDLELLRRPGKSNAVLRKNSHVEDDSDESEGTVDDTCLETQEEINDLKSTFSGLHLRFKIVGKIGEGTFSTVYKAVDLLHDKYINEWDLDDRSTEWHSPPTKRQRVDGVKVKRSKIKYVAVKKIYVTSSPARIQNELELLKDLSGSKNVVSLVTAFRHNDQVVAIMPYFKHVDFREYFRKLEIPEIQLYLRSLFTALKHVHSHNILHRDIKPTNFLYDCRRGRGVLVDFGLAEREETDGKCACTYTPSNYRRDARLPSLLSQNTGCYPKSDQRANRAGTRGFRAPEVLFKCGAQTTKIDIWSAGVILLTFLSKRFPFFNSADDIDAMIEIATIFGKTKMRSCAALHNATFECTLPTVNEKGHSLQRIAEWATARSKTEAFTVDELSALDFLMKCLELDPQKRLSADEALRHKFLTDIATDVSDDEVDTI